MTLELKNLDDDNIRELMLREFENDIAEGRCYFSPRLKEEMHDKYIELMRNAIKSGNDESLAQEIQTNDCLVLCETAKRNNKIITKKVPSDAHFTLAEGEFNRFYLRAICIMAKEIGLKIEVYRAKPVREPRPESQAMIGRLLEPERLLEDLRKNIGVDTALGLPPGPNSGLSGRIKK
jgi:hypothetical protein